MSIHLFVVYFIALLCGLCLCDEFVIDPESGMMTIPKKCFHVCKQGACLFEDCDSPKCPGGACHFINCKKPSCGGEWGLQTSLSKHHLQYYICYNAQAAHVYSNAAQVHRAMVEGKNSMHLDERPHTHNLNAVDICCSCTFRDTTETLKQGYCNGGNCNIDGFPHPDLSSYLTI